MRAASTSLAPAAANTRAVAAPIPLEKEMTFGTDPVQAMRVLDDPSIAPLHARIKQLEDGTFTIHPDSEGRKFLDARDSSGNLQPWHTKLTLGE